MAPSMSQYSQQAVGSNSLGATDLVYIVGYDLSLWLGVVALVFLFRDFLRRWRSSDPGKKVVDTPKAAHAKGRDRKSPGDVLLKGVEVSDVARIADLTISTRMNASKALAYYAEFRDSSRHLNFDKILAAAGSKHTSLDYYAALVQCAGRSGRPQEVERLLDDMVQAGIHRPISIYESAMRLLARQKFFNEALAVYDRLKRDGLHPSPTTLSCLVGFAAELGDGERAVNFFQQLCAQDAPSAKACMTMLRYYGRQGDWSASVALFRDVKQRCDNIDAVMLNIVLATGVAAKEVEAARLLLSEESAVADVVSYNTILKGLAQSGEVDAALDLLNAMHQRGITPNLISVNTAMDAAVRGRKPNEAWRLFELMETQHNVKPDKCTCSTLVKGLQQGSTSEQVAAVLDLAHKVFEECSIQLRNGLLSGALEAAVQISDVALAMRAFAKMRAHQIPPSGRELRSLAVLAAQAGDVQSCSTVWLCAAECDELESARRAVNQQMVMGCTIDAATLSTLGTAESKGKKVSTPVGWPDANAAAFNPQQTC